MEATTVGAAATFLVATPKSHGALSRHSLLPASLFLSRDHILPGSLSKRKDYGLAAVTDLHQSRRWKEKGWSRPIKAVASAEVSTSISETWLLEPVGDGDFRHIGFKVSMPGIYEIVSDVVTVGRLPEKASMVIPVATVSGIHARLEKKGGSLLVTDLDSTNGTFINEKRLKPGVVATVPPGSLITFGDTHLAIFRVSKVIADVQTDGTEIVDNEGSSSVDENLE